MEDSIPKSTRESTKWVDQIFNEWQMGRANKDRSLKSDSFNFAMSRIRVVIQILLTYPLSHRIHGLRSSYKRFAKKTGKGIRGEHFTLWCAVSNGI